MSSRKSKVKKLIRLKNKQKRLQSLVSRLEEKMRQGKQRCSFYTRNGILLEFK